MTLEFSDKDRAAIQSTMLGPEALDAERHPEIAFRSTGAEPAGSGSSKVQGNLTLHGQTCTVVVKVQKEGGHYMGTSRFKADQVRHSAGQSCGGSIRVKDEKPDRVQYSVGALRELRRSQGGQHV